MELTKQQTSILKGIAILMMVCLHLFNRPYEGLYTPLVFIGSTSLIYYISLFCDCCVAIYCFCSGYGLYVGYCENKPKFHHKNKIRVLKLYINYWIILVLFVFILGSILHKFEYIGNWQKIFLNITALDNSYNGTWWFFFTYLLLVFSSPLLFKLINNVNNVCLFVCLFVIYSLTYIQRIKTPIGFDNVFLKLVIKQISLYGTSVFPFILGALFYKHKIFTKISNLFSHIKKRQSIVAILGIVLLMVIHGFIPSLYIAVFTGIVFIILWSLVRVPKSIDHIFVFFGKHSTNIWLMHMFFYMIYFKAWIYSFQYVPIIYVVLIGISVVCSFFINKIYNFAVCKIKVLN